MHPYQVKNTSKIVLLMNKTKSIYLKKNHLAKTCQSTNEVGYKKGHGSQLDVTASCQRKKQKKLLNFSPKFKRFFGINILSEPFNLRKKLVDVFSCSYETNKIVVGSIFLWRAFGLSGNLNKPQARLPFK